MKQRSSKYSQAQSLLEYVIVMGLVTVVFFAIAPLFRRGINAVIKLTADQMATQHNAEQKPSVTTGYLVNNYSATRSTTDKVVTQRPTNMVYTYADTDTTATNSLVNLGFTNRY